MKHRAKFSVLSSTREGSSLHSDPTTISLPSFVALALDSYPKVFIKDFFKYLSGSNDTDKMNSLPILRMNTAIKPSPAPKQVRTPKVALEKSLKAAPSANQAQFVWKTCTEKTDRERVAIKHQAVQDAINHGDTIYRALKRRCKSQQPTPDFTAADMEQIKSWMSEYGEHCSRSSSAHRLQNANVHHGR